MRVRSLLVVCSVASAQTGGAIARSLFPAVGAAGVLLMRLGIAAVVFAVIVRPRVFSWPWRAWAAAASLGVAVAGLTLLSYLAMRTVPLGMVVTASFLGPLVLVLAQTRRAADLGWALLAGAGVVLLEVRPGALAVRGGLLLAFAAGICGAAYILLTARLGALVPGVGGLAVSLGSAAVLVLPFGLPGAAVAVRHPALLLGGASVAVLSSVVPYALEITVLRRMPTRLFGILMSLQPAGAAAAGRLLLGQHLGPVPLAALALVTLASAGATATARTPAAEAADPEVAAGYPEVGT